MAKKLSFITNQLFDWDTKGKMVMREFFKAPQILIVKS